MGLDTGIAWTDSTFNPWWGCQKVDPACAHCYAEAIDGRYGGDHWGPNKERRTFSASHWQEPRKWDKLAAKAGVRRRVFCASMCDWADKDAPPGLRDQLWALIRETPNLDWLMLTKRADRIAECLPPDWGAGYANVWQGVTVGDQAGRWRLDHLTRIPARVRFVSVEPMLEPVDLSSYLWKGCRDCGGVGLVGPDGEACNCARYGRSGHERANLLHWIIVGAESGPGARPMDEDWVRSVRDQCTTAGAGFFYKQKVLKGGMLKIETPELDGRRWVDPPTGIAPRARDVQRQTTLGAAHG